MFQEKKNQKGVALSWNADLPFPREASWPPGPEVLARLGEHHSRPGAGEWLADPLPPPGTCRSQAGVGCLCPQT